MNTITNNTSFNSIYVDSTDIENKESVGVLTNKSTKRPTYDYIGEVAYEMADDIKPIIHPYIIESNKNREDNEINYIKCLPYKIEDCAYIVFLSRVKYFVRVALIEAGKVINQQLEKTGMVNDQDTKRFNDIFSNEYLSGLTVKYSTKIDSEIDKIFKNLDYSSRNNEALIHAKRYLTSYLPITIAVDIANSVYEILARVLFYELNSPKYSIICTELNNSFCIIEQIFIDIIINIYNEFEYIYTFTNSKK